MQKSFTVSVVLFIFVLLASQAQADCAKTVMGGGCSAEAEQGISSHMRASPNKEKASVPATVKAPLAPAKSSKVAVASSQKN